MIPTSEIALADFEPVIVDRGSLKALKWPMRPKLKLLLLSFRLLLQLVLFLTCLSNYDDKTNFLLVGFSFGGPTFEGKRILDISFFLEDPVADSRAYLKKRKIQQGSEILQHFFKQKAFIHSNRYLKFRCMSSLTTHEAPRVRLDPSLTL